MIEVPSAAMTADILAKEADFFSIGTNDLIQYSLAVDRTNEKVAYLYEPSHPAVLRLIKNIIDAAHAAHIDVGMCGEMAGEPYLALILLGLGLDEFSMPPQMIPEIKYIIRSISLSESHEIAHNAMQLLTSKEVEDYSQAKLFEILK
jgi:phosphotransferase system enzyme I (PtsI)